MQFLLKKAVIDNEGNNPTGKTIILNRRTLYENLIIDVRFSVWLKFKSLCKIKRDQKETWTSNC